MLAAALAAGWYLRRKGLPGGPPRPELAGPPEPIDAHVDAVAAVSDAADVSSVIEDLRAAEPEVVDVEDETR